MPSDQVSTGLAFRAFHAVSVRLPITVQSLRLTDQPPERVSPHSESTAPRPRSVRPHPELFLIWPVWLAAVSVSVSSPLVFGTSRFTRFFHRLLPSSLFFPCGRIATMRGECPYRSALLAEL